MSDAAEKARREGLRQGQKAGERAAGQEAGQEGAQGPKFTVQRLGAWGRTVAEVEAHEEMCLDCGDPRPWGRNRTKPVEPAKKPTAQAARLRKEADSWGKKKAPGPTKEDVRCYTVSSKDSITIEGKPEAVCYEYIGPAPLLKHGFRNDTWDINVDEDSRETTLTHQSTERRAFMSRQDAVEAASVRLVDRIWVYAKRSWGEDLNSQPALLQLPDDYFEFDGDGEAPNDESLSLQMSAESQCIPMCFTTFIGTCTAPDVRSRSVR